MNTITTTVELTVTGMSCGSCVRHVDAALREVSGVLDANVDLQATRATVVYDPARTAQEELVAAVAQAGYSASAIEPQAQSAP